ncbi:MAG TPA: S-methyl-5'-thioadenosine phosphorylase [Armatimonadota bacterium]|nr:S-methyl-5'-thioadenosine phosphorylase [Armatimonadota bacterium]
MTASIGVFGGSGFYAFLDDVRHVTVETPYGPPSDQIALARISGREIAFLPRHGRAHQIPPHSINYRANIYAMKELGVSRILAPTAVGSLQKEIRRGDFVVVDQFIDRTRGRRDTFFDGPEVAHIAGVEPYCRELRERIIEVGEASRRTDGDGARIHPAGTVVVINGPRFSTRAESRWFSSFGWDVINMTQYPEVALARELGICYANISLVTDYDAGLAEDADAGAVSIEEVLRVLSDNNERVKRLLLAVVESLPDERGCDCAEQARQARI